MIIRLVAIDPRPREGKSDIVVYQVPENSRELQLLIELFDHHNIEHTTLVTARKPRSKKP